MGNTNREKERTLEGNANKGKEMTLEGRGGECAVLRRDTPYYSNLSYRT
jgi:hypothetical protein